MRSASAAFGRKSNHRSKFARGQRRVLGLESLEDRRLLAGLAAEGSQIWHSDISEIPNGSVTAIAGVGEHGDRFGNGFATGDFNGDGFADAAIGAPEEDIGDVQNAGAVNVIYGSASGLTGGFGNSRNELWYQGESGVPGDPQPGAEFGAALAAGDFDGDGYDDLVIGTVDPFAGSVQILLGSESGLTATGGRRILSTDPQIDLPGYFGLHLAVGRFGNSGTDQLVISAHGHEVNGQHNAGSVAVIHFQPGGLLILDVQVWNQDSPGIDGSSESLDVFGWSLAVGDFNGDSHDDLAVGLIESDGSTDAVGAVSVIFGSVQGLTSANDESFWQNTPGVANSNEFADLYGAALAAGDFDGDGFDDLAVGVPGEDNGGSGSSHGRGRVNIVYGSTDGLINGSGLVDGSQDFRQGEGEIEGIPENNDQFGTSLIAADFNADGFVDLAVGTPQEHFMGFGDGVMHVIYGSSTGLKTANTAPGNEPRMFSAHELSGFTFDNMEFGWDFGAADFDADGITDLMVGMPGLTAGKAYAMYGSSAGLTATASARQYWHQNIAGSSSTLQNGARFGKQLATGDFNGDGKDDLAIGVPGYDLPMEQRWGKEGAGIVNVLYGDDDGEMTSTRPPQVLHQDLLDYHPPEHPHGAELFDGFGSALAVGDFNDDGFDDLVVGSPFEGVQGRLNAGAIHLIFGRPQGLDPTTSVMVHQGTPGIVGGAETGDQFGSALAAADFNADGIDDIAIGVPFESVGSEEDAGVINVLYGSPVTINGLPNSAFSNEMWTSNSLGVPVAAGDLFGWSLAVGDVDGNGVDDLAIGIPGRDVGGAVDAGALAMLKGSTQGLTTSIIGLDFLSENSLSGVSETGDQFGYALAIGNFNNDGFDDLVVGTPFEDLLHSDLSMRIDAGAVTVAYGAALGPTSAHVEFWHQSLGDSSGTEALGVAGLGKHFGYALTAGDFNADQHDDLAVGVPNESFAAPLFALAAGRVNVIYSSPNGLDQDAQQRWDQAVPGIEDTHGFDDHFGSALATGDFNGDGADDLAVGVPDNDATGFINTGMVHTILGMLAGDFSRDGNLTCEDIDALTAAAASGANDTFFDLTDDGLVNLDDVTHWILELKGTLPGDANLDGTVDGLDFVIWNAHKFTNTAAWCSGDFDANGFVDGLDYVIWNTYKFQSAAPRAVDLGDRLPQSNAVSDRYKNIDDDWAQEALPVSTPVIAPALTPWSGTELHRSSRSVNAGDADDRQPTGDIGSSSLPCPECGNRRLPPE